MKGAFWAVVTILILVIVGSVLFLLFAPAPDQEVSLSEISFGEPFALQISEEIQVDEHTSVVFEDILQDSRCPIDGSVNCVWEGTVVALVSTTKRESNEENAIEEVHETFELELNEDPVALGGDLSMALTHVSPEQSAEELDAALYELTFIITKSAEAEDVTDAPPEEVDLTLYFSSEMEKRGNEILGSFPIEGFTPFSYLNAYPGLEKSDFSGADALQGVYEIREGEILFVLDDTDTIHSAAETLSKMGMQTLLDAVSIRLALPVNTPAQIDQIIEKIQ